MPIVYFSSYSSDLEPAMHRVLTGLESFFHEEFTAQTGGEGFDPARIRHTLEHSNVLVVALGGGASSVKSVESSIEDPFASERVRFEIVSAMHLDLIIIPLLIDDASLPDKRLAPGSVKRLLDCKSYRLKYESWSQDLQRLCKDLQQELEFKTMMKSNLKTDPMRDLMESEAIRGNTLGQEFISSLEGRRVVELAQHQLDEARRKNNRIEEKSALSALGLAYARLGQTQKSIEYFEEQLALVRDLGDIGEECPLLANLGDACAVTGNVAQARKYYERQLELSIEADDRASIASAHNGLGFVCVKQNQIDTAIEHYQQALLLYRELKMVDKELELLVGVGLNQLKLKRWQDACDNLEQALDLSRYLENREEETRLLVDLGDAHFQLGNFQRVNACLNQAEDSLSGTLHPGLASLKSQIQSIRGALPPVK
ncbi:MAG: tetratricopeptide repeat protein [Candidatus Nitrohelix vancouverensis]|uniref:Tetratricopeptide repeat protein n=1 Tax=Candidatus Nitrohelix vancouverensis TaxID=2705534 RepID=A0A7T0C1K0_9BACT|nr:MAG: tetratricopeptide repeat protein [Candidatus Nitrohelix vancouverensis]